MLSPLRSVRREALGLVVLVVLAAPAFSQGSGETAPGAPPERTIYVPYRDLKGVFEQLGAGVFVPYSEWLKMRRQLEQGGPDGQAVKAVITESSYVATVEKDLVRINAKLRINVLGQPWVEVPVKFGDAAGFCCAFYGLDFASLELHRKQQAPSGHEAIDNNRARTADSVLTSDMRTRETHFVTDEVGSAQPR